MKLVTFLYPGMTTLDMVGPHEVLARLPDAEVIRVAEQAGPVTADTGLQLIADAGIGDIDSADILFNLLLICLMPISKSLTIISFQICKTHCIGLLLWLLILRGLIRHVGVQNSRLAR